MRRCCCTTDNLYSCGTHNKWRIMDQSIQSFPPIHLSFKNQFNSIDFYSSQQLFSSVFRAFFSQKGSRTGIKTSSSCFPIVCTFFTVWPLCTVWQSVISPKNEAGRLHTHIHGICEIFPLERETLWNKTDRDEGKSVCWPQMSLSYSLNVL